MTEKRKVEVDLSHPGIIVVDGKKYVAKKTTTKKIGNITHGDKIIYEEMKETEHEEEVKKLISKLREQVDVDTLLKELLKEYPTKYLKNFNKRLYEKDHPVQRQAGCLGFQIGDGKGKGGYLQLID